MTTPLLLKTTAGEASPRIASKVKAIKDAAREKEELIASIARDRLTAWMTKAELIARRIETLAVQCGLPIQITVDPVSREIELVGPIDTDINRKPRDEARGYSVDDVGHIRLGVNHWTTTDAFIDALEVQFVDVLTCM